MARECSTHEGDKRHVRPTKFCLTCVKGRDQDIWDDNIRVNLEKFGCRVLIQFVWFRI
jgi:hypothetical protein